MKVLAVLVLLGMIAGMYAQRPAGSEELRLQIESLLNQANVLRYDRFGSFNTFHTKFQTLASKRTSYFAARQQVLSDYEAYYNKKLFCEGLKQKMQSLYGIQQLPTNTCPEVPISAQAQNLFQSRLTLEGALKTVDYHERLVQKHQEYAVDYRNEAAVYTYLKQIYTQKVSDLQLLLSSCEGSACDGLQESLNEAQLLKSQYYNKEWEKSNEAIISEQILTMQIQTLTAKQNQKAQAQAYYDQQKSYVQGLKDQCQAQLIPLTQALDNSLTAANDLKQQIDALFAQFPDDVILVTSQTSLLRDKLDEADAKIAELEALFA